MTPIIFGAGLIFGALIVGILIALPIDAWLHRRGY